MNVTTLEGMNRQTPICVLIFWVWPNVQKIVPVRTETGQKRNKSYDWTSNGKQLNNVLERDVLLDTS